MTGTEKIHAMWLFNKKAEKKRKKAIKGKYTLFQGKYFRVMYA